MPGLTRVVRSVDAQRRAGRGDRGAGAPDRLPLPRPRGPCRRRPAVDRPRPRRGPGVRPAPATAAGSSRCPLPPAGPAGVPVRGRAGGRPGHRPRQPRAQSTARSAPHSWLALPGYARARPGSTSSRCRVPAGAGARDAGRRRRRAVWSPADAGRGASGCRCWSPTTAPRWTRSAGSPATSAALVGAGRAAADAGRAARARAPATSATPPTRRTPRALAQQVVPRLRAAYPSRRPAGADRARASARSPRCTPRGRHPGDVRRPAAAVRVVLHPGARPAGVGLRRFGEVTGFVAAVLAAAGRRADAARRSR